MCEAIDNGKTRVVNKGVDVTVIASSEAVAEAMKASRTLVVKGISTAVIEVLTIDPLDEETFSSFAQKTGAMIFIEQWLYEAAEGLLSRYESLIVEVAKDKTPQGIIETTLAAVKRKLGK